MLGQITYPPKSTGDVVDNLMGNTEAAKVLPLSAYQGYILDGKIAAINNNFRNIQVASLTVTTQETSAAGQPVTIANIAYTITANFDNTLRVTVPIYTWGDYKVACGVMSEAITISPESIEYNVELKTGLLLFSDGVNLLGNMSSYGSDGNTGKPIPTSQWYVKVDSNKIEAYIVAYDVYGMCMDFGTENTFNLSKYRYLEIELEVSGSSYTNSMDVGGVKMFPFVARDITSGTLKRIMDISGTNETSSINFRICASSAAVTWRIKQITLLH